MITEYHHIHQQKMPIFEFDLNSKWPKVAVSDHSDLDLCTPSTLTTCSHFRVRTRRQDNGGAR